jgi:hypothetical protein
VGNKRVTKQPNNAIAAGFCDVKDIDNFIFHQPFALK